ncbi:MAG: TadE family protein [Pirellulaceae bacterium]
MYHSTAQAERSPSIDPCGACIRRSFIGRCHSRRGIEVLEAILVIPILLIAILSGFLFGPLIAVDQMTRSAAEDAAREGAKQRGGQVVEEIVAEVVTPILAVHGLSLDPGGGAMVIVEQLNQVSCLGDVTQWNDCPETSSVIHFAEVRVTVRVAVEAAPIPQVLAYFGIDLTPRTLECTAVARRDLGLLGI